MNNVSNRIISTDRFKDSHEEERKVRCGVHETMTTCLCGTKALHETNGEDNFGIIKMMDEKGTSPPQGTVECVMV